MPFNPKTGRFEGYGGPKLSSGMEVRKVSGPVQVNAPARGGETELAGALAGLAKGFGDTGFGRMLQRDMTEYQGLRKQLRDEYGWFPTGEKLDAMRADDRYQQMVAAEDQAERLADTRSEPGVVRPMARTVPIPNLPPRARTAEMPEMKDAREQSRKTREAVREEKTLRRQIPVYGSSMRPAI